MATSQVKSWGCGDVVPEDGTYLLGGSLGPTGWLPPPARTVFKGVPVTFADNRGRLRVLKRGDLFPHPEGWRADAQWIKAF